MIRRVAPAMRAVVDRRVVKTDTGFFCIVRLACGHECNVFPQDGHADTPRRNCKECQNASRAKAIYMDRLDGKKLDGKKPPKLQKCRRCNEGARWPYALCSTHLEEVRRKKRDPDETVVALRQAVKAFDDVVAMVRRVIERLEHPGVASPGDIICSECMARARPGLTRCEKHLRMVRASVKRHQSRRRIG
jgi:hypothetical protein